MTETPRWKPAVRRATLALILVALVACRDTQLPTTGNPFLAARLVPNSSAAIDTAWDAFAEDVTITVARFDTTGRQLDRRFLPIHYHLAKTLAASGLWHTVMTYPSRIRGAVSPGVGKFAPEVTEIGRIEDNGDGSPPQFYNGLGALMTAPTALPTGPLPPSFPPIPAKSNKTFSPVAPFDHSWVRSSILPASEVASRNAAMQSKWGTATRTAAGFDQYAAHLGQVSRVVLVDPSIGAPTDITETRNGQTVLHTTIGYTKDQTGDAVRASVRFERFHYDKHPQRLVTQIQFANVSISKGN